MSAPLDFVKRLAAELKEAGIRFAITSGMACVHYGLPREPLDAAGREAAFTQGLRRAANLTGADDAELAFVCPPHSEILP